MDTKEHFTKGPGIIELWLGLLLGPIAALLQLQTNYALVSTACTSGKAWPLHLVSLTGVLIALCAALVSYRCWVRLGASWDEEPAGTVGRARFMSAVGILISLLMLLVNIAQWIPVFIYGPCQRWL
jgi:hypothetical protein